MVNGHHRLRIVRSVNKTGDPQKACFAECTCRRYATASGTILEVGRAFDEHLTINGAPLGPAPWRAP